MQPEKAPDPRVLPRTPFFNDSHAGKELNVCDEFPPLVFWQQYLPVELDFTSVVRRGREGVLVRADFLAYRFLRWRKYEG